MPIFNFITSDQFRESLENDYKELRNSLEARSWKSVQILSGSIVEALLIDYITASNMKIPSGKDVLKITLAEAITICKSENIISERTADLCSVIRSYRNLIHPARQIRLGEISPSQQSANIASSLVDLIIEEIIKARKKSYGFTAEQIVAKLENDHNSIALLPHLLKEVHEAEIERLLWTIIPSVLSQKYFDKVAQS
jgi:hypothetical protein